MTVYVLSALSNTQDDGGGCLFHHEDCSPLTKYWFWAVTSRALTVLGMSGFRIGAYSFRTGFASTAAAMGYFGSAIQQMEIFLLSLMCDLYRAYEQGFSGWLLFTVSGCSLWVVLCHHGRLRILITVFWAAYQARHLPLGSQLGPSVWPVI